MINSVVTRERAESCECIVGCRLCAVLRYRFGFSINCKDQKHEADSIASCARARGVCDARCARSICVRTPLCTTRNTESTCTRHAAARSTTRAHHTPRICSQIWGRAFVSANPGRHPQRVDPAQVHALAALELLVPWWVYARVGWMVPVHVIAPCDTHASQLGESHRCTSGLGDGTAPRRWPSGARRQV